MPPVARPSGSSRCRDADFWAADVAVLRLDVNNLNPTYSRHFLERAADA